MRFSISHWAYLFIVVLTGSECAHSDGLPNGDKLHGVWHQDQGYATISEPTRLANGNNSHRKTSQVQYSIEASESAQDKCNFRGQHLRVAVSPQPPLVNCHQELYGNWLCNGSNIEVVRVMEKRFNFVADWVVLANNHLEITNSIASAKTPRPRDTWNEQNDDNMSIEPEQAKQAPESNSKLTATNREDFGVIGLVANGRAMFSANGVMRTMDREKSRAVLISEPFDYFQLHFMLSKTIKDHDHIFLKPFSLHSWLAILGSSVLIVPIFYLINTTSCHYVIQNDTELKELGFWPCFEHAVLRHLRNTVAHLFRFNRDASKRRKSTSASSDESFEMVVQELMSAGVGSVMALEQLGQSRQRSAKFLKQQQRLKRQEWKLQRKRARRIHRRDSKRTGFFNLPYIVWYVVASLANQGGETEDLPRANSTRVLIAFWWLYLIVICAVHAGILTAILTFPKQRDFVQTLEDYLDLNPSEVMKLVVDKNSELGYLLHHEEDLHKSSLETLIRHYTLITHSPVSFEDFHRHRQRVLDEVQSGKTAFLEEKSTIDHIITQEYFDTKPPKCLFKSSRFPIDVIPMGFVLSPKIPATCIEAFNGLLGKILRSGLARKWRRKFEARGNDCLNTVIINAGDVDKIEMKHVILAFWLLFGGIMSGLIVLIGEVAWLFTFGEDDNDEDECSTTTSSDSLDSYSSSSSSSLATMKLGHRRAGLMNNGFQPRPIKSLQNNIAKISINRLKKQERIKNRLSRSRMPMQLPSVTFELEQNGSKIRSGESFDLFEEPLNTTDLIEQASFTKKRSHERRRRRLARAAEKRARRLKKTLDLAKRIQDGRVYSNTMRSSVRRASEAIMRKFSTKQTPKQSVHKQSTGESSGSGAHPESDITTHLTVRRRRKFTGQGKVAPLF